MRRGAFPGVLLLPPSRTERSPEAGGDRRSGETPGSSVATQPLILGDEGQSVGGMPPGLDAGARQVGRERWWMSGARVCKKKE